MALTRVVPHCHAPPGKCTNLWFNTLGDQAGLSSSTEHLRHMRHMQHIVVLWSDSQMICETLPRIDMPTSMNELLNELERILSGVALLKAADAVKMHLFECQVLWLDHFYTLHPCPCRKFRLRHVTALFHSVNAWVFVPLQQPLIKQRARRTAVTELRVVNMCSVSTHCYQWCKLSWYHLITQACKICIL